MKSEQYIPLVTDLLNQKNVNHLVLDKKAKGLGIYMAILMELRRREDYTGDRILIRTLSKIIGTSPSLIKQVISDYGLFDITEDSEDIKFTSPYLNQAMTRMEASKARLTQRAKKAASKRWRKDMTVTDACALPIYSNSNNTTCSSEQEDNSKAWEKLIDQAVKDNYWLELLASRSGWGTTFHTCCHEIIQAFKEHVLVQGNEHNIQSLPDAKNYLANFLRPGTRTHKYMCTYLKRAEKERSEKHPYRFENVDPTTGQRSYYGQTIPNDAPPRPNENAIWDNGRSQWMK